MAVTIGTIAEAIGAPNAASAWAPNLARWSDLYACKPREKTLNLHDGAHKRRIRSLGMAKRICEDWAGLLWTENAEIEVGDTAGNEHVATTLGDDFSPQFTDFLERAMAKGCGGVELLLNGLAVNAAGTVVPDGKASLTPDFVDAERIIPLSWDRGKIREVAFVSFPSNNTAEVREHHKDKGGWRIVNRFFTLKDGKLYEVPADDLIAAGVAPELFVASPYPLFALFAPAIVNNLDMSSPYGVSVFANAEDQLATVDLIFDNFAEDFELGGKMVFLSDTMLRKDSNSNIIPPQRDKKNLFVALEGTFGVEGGFNGVHEHNPDLRVEDNKLGIETALSLLSANVGMGDARYHFTSSGVKTAHEVVSENSDLFRTRRKHMLVVTSVLTTITRAALWCGANLMGVSCDPEAEIVIRSDDSVIEDDGTRIARGLTLLQNSAISQRTFLVDYLGMTEDDADAEVARTAVKAAPLF